MYGIDEDDGVYLVEGAILPFLYLRQEFVRHVGDEAFGCLEAVDVHERVRDLARAHPLGIEGDDLLVDGGDVLLSFPDHLRLEA